MLPSVFSKAVASTVAEKRDSPILKALPHAQFALFPVLLFAQIGPDLTDHDSKCILQLRGVRPFLSDKYDLTQHPNFKYTADFDRKYTFDIEKYLNRRMKLKKDEVFDVVKA